MSHFSDGQLRQVGNALEVAGWLPQDLTLFGQAGRDRLIVIRDSLRRRGDIVDAIMGGRTELWLHPGQVSRVVCGYVIYDHLQTYGLLPHCVDLDELKAIRLKGTSFFREHFPEKAIFAWRDVRGGFVPFLIESENRLMLDQCSINDHFGPRSIALRRK